MTSSRHKLEHSKNQFNIRFFYYFFFPTKVNKYWHKLPCEVVEPPSWEAFRNWQEIALSNMFSLDTHWTGSWTRWLPGSLPAWIIWWFCKWLMLNSGTILFYHKQMHKIGEPNHSLEMVISLHWLPRWGQGFSRWMTVRCLQSGETNLIH